MTRRSGSGQGRAPLAVDQPQIAQVDKQACGLAEDADDVLAPDKIEQEHAGPEQAHPPEGHWDHGPPFPLTGDPLDDHAAGEKDLAQEADGDPHEIDPGGDIENDEEKVGLFAVLLGVELGQEALSGYNLVLALKADGVSAIVAFDLELVQALVCVHGAKPVRFLSGVAGRGCTNEKKGEQHQGQGNNIAWHGWSCCTGKKFMAAAVPNREAVSGKAEFAWRDH